MNFTGTVWRRNQKVGSSNSPGAPFFPQVFNHLGPTPSEVGPLFWMHCVQQGCFESGTQSLFRSRTGDALRRFRLLHEKDFRLRLAEGFSFPIGEYLMDGVVAGCDPTDLALHMGAQPPTAGSLCRSLWHSLMPHQFHGSSLTPRA